MTRPSSVARYPRSMSVRAVATAVVTIAAALGLVAGAQGGSAAPPVRVTVFGDSAATAMAYDPDAKRTLGRGIDLRLEVLLRRDAQIALRARVAALDHRPAVGDLGAIPLDPEVVPAEAVEGSAPGQHVHAPHAGGEQVGSGIVGNR